MAPEHPQPANLRELRILVLHNNDFDHHSPRTATATGDESADHRRDGTRVDVANAAQNIARALVSRGHFVEVQGIDRDDLGDLLAQLRQDPPDLVYNLVESLSGESRHAILVPALLELLGIPCTGSSTMTLAVTTSKYQAKNILRSTSIPTPLGTLLPAERRPAAEDLAAVESIGYPLFLKLSDYNGATGITGGSIVRNDEGLIRQLELLRSRYRGPIIAERYIEGRELCVAVLGNQPRRILPLQEVDFSLLPDRPPIVSEHTRREAQSGEYQLMTAGPTAPIPEPVFARIGEVARQAFDLMEFRDYGRIDIRLSQNGTPYVIDLNPNCDLSDGASYCRAGQLAGLSYDQLIEEIALSAIKRSAHAHVQRHRSDPGASRDLAGVA